jgi:hypothetical protein
MARAFPILLGVLLAVTSAGCSDASTDETPSGALRLFLAAMERTERDPAAAREAYRLLSTPTRRALVERAQFAASLGGGDLAPWDMLVRGGYRQTFSAARGARGMREQIDGERATVLVTNEARDRSAEVPLVREEGRWRIVIAIPPVRERRAD